MHYEYSTRYNHSVNSTEQFLELWRRYQREFPGVRVHREIVRDFFLWLIDQSQDHARTDAEWHFLTVVEELLDNDAWYL